MTAAGPEALEGREEPLARVERTVRRSGTSFFWGMRVLPRARREAIYAVYAYCREIDDIADGDQPAAAKLADLAWWREEVERLAAGRARHPVTRALTGPMRRFGLPKAEFLALLDGMERDARGGVVARNEADLRGYCRQVAGAVGMLAMHIFAADDPRADSAACEELAVTLGEALQLTNILRDLGDDAARGRLYLPETLLRGAGVRAREPLAVLDDPALPGACAELAAMARRRFARSRTLIDGLSRSTARPCRLMLVIYERLLDRLEAGRWQRPARRVRVPGWEKLWIVLRHGVL